MILDQLRKHLAASKVTVKQIGESSGVHPVNISQFKSGARKTLPVDQVERLARAIGLEVVIRPAKRKKNA